MKKLFVLALSVCVFAACFTGCGNKDNYNPTTEPTTSVSPVPSAVTAPTAKPVFTPGPGDFPPVNVAKDGNALITADYLTPIIVISMETVSAPANPVFNEFKALCCLSFTEDSGSCYKGIFPEVNYLKQFRINDANRVIYHLFGATGFDAMDYADKLPNGRYNPDTDALEFSTDFGWGMTFYHCGDYVHSKFSDDGTRVISEFELFVPDTSSGEPGSVSDGTYNLIYDIVSENGETFLRVNRFEKIRR